MNPDLDRLQAYPFERLARLLEGSSPPRDLAPILLSIGEPRHPTPGFISEALIEHLHGLSQYPLTRGSAELRGSIAEWLTRREGLAPLDPESQVLPVNGTREALFAFAQCVLDRSTHPLVLMPNPFYQIYEGAALLAGAEPCFLNNRADNGFLPDYDAVPEEVWRRCKLLYLCTPDNPTGRVTPRAVLQSLIERAERYDFVIASDECYAELYPDEGHPPLGLLSAAAALGNDAYRRCVVFHSLSKRSNVPGLRSGFVAGDAAILKRFLLYRTYHGCAMSPPTQAASARAWRDERHVRDNRALYRAKFDAVLPFLAPVMTVTRPDAGFYLWPEVAGDDTAFTRALYESAHVTVLPGSFLSRDTQGENPGRGRVRLALVAPIEDCIEAAQRIRRFVEQRN
jgi:N-succinyldiaminopimelate aminotransferase